MRVNKISIVHEIIPKRDLGMRGNNQCDDYLNVVPPSTTSV